ncbi:nucleotide exchange factor GrpE [bacterium]|nr:nucleotide exchange factor GrpE [bacterium]
MAAEDRPTEERANEPAGTASAPAEPRTHTKRTKRTDTKTLRKCAACGRSAPSARSRCVWCGALLPVGDEGEGKDKKAEKKDEEPREEKPKTDKQEDLLHETAEAALAAATAPSPEPPRAEQADSHAPESPAAPEVTLEALIEAAAASSPPAESAAPAPQVETPEKASPKPEKPAAQPARTSSERLPQQGAPPKGAAKPAAHAPDKHHPSAHGPTGTVRGQLVPPSGAAHAVTKDAGHVSAKDLAPLQRDVALIKASIEHVNGYQRSFDNKLVLVAKAVEELAKDSQKRRKDYDALYAEMRDYKTNFIDVSQKPLYMDLLLLFDSILREVRVFEEGPETVARAEVLKAIGQVKDELVEILYRRDVELIEDHPTKLDVSFQKPVRRVEVEDVAEDYTIVQRVREGFRRGDQILRPQEVVVKRCVGAQTEGPAADGDTTETALPTDGAGPADPSKESAEAEEAKATPPAETAEAAPAETAGHEEPASQ